MTPDDEADGHPRPLVIQPRPDAGVVPRPIGLYIPASPMQPLRPVNRPDPPADAPLRSMSPVSRPDAPAANAPPHALSPVSRPEPAPAAPMRSLSPVSRPEPDPNYAETVKAERKWEAEMLERQRATIPLHRINGVVEHVPAYPPLAAPGWTPPARTSQPAAADPKLDDICKRVFDIDEDVGRSDRVRPRASQLLRESQAEWMNWGQRELDFIRAGAQTQHDIAERFRRLDVTKQVVECQEASRKVPNMIERRLMGNRAAFWQERLNGLRPQVTKLLGEAQGLRIAQTPKAETLRIDVVIMQAFVETLTDVAAQAIAGGRHRSLVAAQQGAGVFLASLSQMEIALTTALSNLDDLLNIVIPQWQIALSKL